MCVMSMASGWKTDKLLVSDLERYVQQNLRRCEILDFVTRDFPSYPWSLPTLARRLSYFKISYIDASVDVEMVKEIVRNELSGPGKLLGYRAMTQKLRTVHGIKVPRHLVHNILFDLDPEGLNGRRLQNKQRRTKEPFTSRGPLWVLSVDGHDKLCGYQNWMFPLGLYGFIDTFSRKVLSLAVVFSNSDPKVIGRLYFDLLYKTKTLPVFIRMDKGTETGKMAAMHSYIMSKQDFFENPVDSVVYGPSTTNKIERWWRDLHERLEGYFKQQLKTLLEQKEYDPCNEIDRQLLGYVFIPVLQRECDKFVNIWNSHRIREQANMCLSTGVPDHLFNFPEQYGGQKMGIEITNDQLQEVAEVSGILETNNFINKVLHQMCQQHLPHPENLPCSETMNAYLFLKEKHKLISINTL